MTRLAINKANKPYNYYRTVDQSLHYLPLFSSVHTLLSKAAILSWCLPQPHPIRANIKKTIENNIPTTVPITYPLSPRLLFLYVTS